MAVPVRSQRFCRRALSFLAGLVCAWAFAFEAAPQIQTGVVFDQYTPLSRNAELARRLLSPLAAALVQRQLDASGEEMREQPVDLAKERFVLHVPVRAPEDGYGLLVFIPPWPDARLPAGWAGALDRHGVIFISAANIGNDDNAFGRREPLALIAAQNVMARYKVDPGRVYVGGFSGGSRVAMRLALAYPDVFRGAFLNAGSDAEGEAINRLPPKPLLQQAQERLRLVFVTGQQDEANQIKDADAVRSMRDNCLFDLATRSEFGLGHEVAAGNVLSQALDLLDAPRTPQPQKLAACRARLQDQLDKGVGEAQALLAKGDREGARKRIVALDIRFAGLAEQRLVELAKSCGCGLFPAQTRP